jgi:hypothetical protein
MESDRLMSDSSQIKHILKPPKEWEKGLDASCWHCDTQFQKKKWCKECGYYICPNCGKCGCHLSPEVKSAMDKTFKALTPVFRNWIEKKKVLKQIYKEMRTLEYILDSTNQKRKRQDEAVQKAWGHAFRLKGLVIDLVDFYQPTLLMIEDKFARNKNNPTWTKRAKKVFEITQKAKGVKKI